MLSTYAVLAYASTPYMTGEHGIHWMMMIVPKSCVHIFVYIYVMHFVAYVLYPVNFHHILRTKRHGKIKFVRFIETVHDR